MKYLLGTLTVLTLLLMTGCSSLPKRMVAKNAELNLNNPTGSITLKAAILVIDELGDVSDITPMVTAVEAMTEAKNEDK